MKTKPTFILLLTFIVSLCPLIFNNLAIGQDQTRWWQREILTPSENQAINPDYLHKKRELEQAWDQLKEDMKAKSHFSSLGQNTSSLNAAVSSSRNKVRNLEHELSQIPMYIPVTKPVPPTTTGTPPSLQYNAEIARQNPILDESSPSAFSGLRIRFDPFHHFPDPNGIDYRSYEKLGDVGAYILRIYPALAMKDITSALKLSEEAKSVISMPKGVVGVTIMRDDDKYVRGNIRNARELMTGEIRTKLAEFVKKGAIFQFNFLDIPPYADVPLPPGTYYLEYSLWFPRAKNSLFKYCHPNYKGRSPFEPQATTSWGPSKVVLGSASAAQIQFTPTLAICGYKYLNNPIKYGMVAFENSDAFWDWISFIRWKGTWNPGDEEKETSGVEIISGGGK